jgi:hypothetical protein
MFPLYTTVLFAFKRLLGIIRRKKERSLNIDAQEPRRYRIIKVQNLRKKNKRISGKDKRISGKKRNMLENPAEFAVPYLILGPLSLFYCP